MFDIGFAELLIIGVVALVVLGPERLPVAARTAGLWIGRIRRSVSNIQSEISEELRAEELRRDIAVSKKQLDDELTEMRQPFIPTTAPTTGPATAPTTAPAQTPTASEPATESAVTQLSTEAETAGNTSITSVAAPENEKPKDSP